MAKPQLGSLLPLMLGGAATGLVVVCYWWHCQTVQKLQTNAENRRLEERKGRIRAEVKLRTLWKEKEALELALPRDGDGSDDRRTDSEHVMVLHCIGTVVSPFAKRMGTPRQGSLVPSSRAFIQLQVPTEALDGIECYSHLWIIFAFHANTDTFHNHKTKVRPPRADRKVGQLATRSPHRPNPLGLSLVKMERLDTKRKRLYISALDLVHGTPVYDVKPCVPFDIPSSSLRVPDWVDRVDSIPQVQFTSQAEVSLRELLVQERLAPLYTCENDGLTAAMATLREVLAQDPRSSHKGLKVNRRGSASSNIETYSLVFAKTQVEFRVLPEGVRVENVIPIDFGEEAYVQGIPLISNLGEINEEPT